MPPFATIKRPSPVISRISSCASMPWVDHSARFSSVAASRTPIRPAPVSRSASVVYTVRPSALLRAWPLKARRGSIQRQEIARPFRSQRSSQSPGRRATASSVSPVSCSKPCARVGTSSVRTIRNSPAESCWTIPTWYPTPACHAAASVVRSGAPIARRCDPSSAPSPIRKSRRRTFNLRPHRKSRCAHSKPAPRLAPRAA